MTDIDLLADPFDTWQAFESRESAWEERLIQKYSSIENAEWDARRDDYEMDCGDND